MNKYSITKLPSDILKQVADRHRTLRKANNYSQAALAVRSGVSLGTIKRFESSGQISFESLLKLAYFLNSLQDFETIFFRDDNIEKLEKLFTSKK